MLVMKNFKVMLLIFMLSLGFSSTLSADTECDKCLVDIINPQRVYFGKGVDPERVQASSVAAGYAYGRCHAVLEIKKQNMPCWEMADYYRILYNQLAGIVEEPDGEGCC